MKTNQLGKRAPVQKRLLHDHLKGKETHIAKVPTRGAGAGQGTGAGVGVRAKAGAGIGAMVRVKGGERGH